MTTVIVTEYEDLGRAGGGISVNSGERAPIYGLPLAHTELDTEGQATVSLDPRTSFVRVIPIDGACYLGFGSNTPVADARDYVPAGAAFDQGVRARSGAQAVTSLTVAAVS